jgi:general L-amino acid transport system permease protein
VTARAERDHLAPRSGSLLNDARVRGLIFQIIVAVLLALIAAFIVINTTRNLQRLGIASGFDFLWATAGFDIGVRLIPYEITSTYGRAFLVGLVNTLTVAAAGIVLATILGLILGILRLSRNWLVAKLAAVYVELARNIPLLLQIFFWYFAIVLGTLPALRQSLAIFDMFFVNNRGVYMPRPILQPGAWVIPAALGVGIVAAVLLYRWAKRRQERTGERFPALRFGLLLIVALPILAAALAGFPVEWQFPVLKGFNFNGGMVIQPEFVALLLALTLYTAGFIGEIVRAGIQSVSHGQTEAAYALGLRPGATLRLVIIPQALRVIVPPLTSQYLNITKNSSLAVAIGYPELVSVFAGTVLNQTGQAVEVIVITMLVYMTISLIISVFMNWYNRRIALVER